MKQIRVSVWGFILAAILLSGSGCHKKQEGQMINSPAGASNQGSTITLSTMNCYWFLGEEDYRAADKPRTTEDYDLKAGHLIGLLPADAPLLVGLQEIGNDKDVQALAYSASRRYNRTYQPLFVQGKDTATRQDVGALFDPTQGWGVYGRPSRVSDLEHEVSKHLVMRLTNATTHMDVCIVHLRVPRDEGGQEKQTEQNRALLQWSMRHLAKDPKANVVIMGDFNEGKPVGSPEQSLAVLFQARPPMVDTLTKWEGKGKAKTHANGGSFDRVLISEAMLQGLSGLKFDGLTIGTHGHGKGEERRTYTDHFPVSVKMQVGR